MCCVGSWFHIWDTSRTVGGIEHWRWRNDRRSERNLCNCVKKPEKKNSGLQRGLNPWPRKEHVEHCYRTLLRSPGRNDEASSHAQSTWRLHTPTICGRSVPAQCNAGLPKKKTLQQGKINRKKIQIVLVQRCRHGWASSLATSQLPMEDYLWPARFSLEYHSGTRA